MTKKCSLLFALTGLLTAVFCLNVKAQGIGSGIVQNIYATTTGQIFVQTESKQSQPACALWGFAFDLNGAAAVGGKAMLAQLMAAQASGRPINIVGKGVCDVWGDRETIVAVNINN